MSKRVARCAMLIALAMIFSYVEVLIPINFGIPGIKLGIANLVVVVGFYLLKPQEVFLISIIRILLMGYMFGNGMTLIYSLSGGLLSFLLMLLIKQRKSFSVVGVSVVGGVSHNIGQIAAAAAVMHTSKILYYLPVLLIAGTVTGTLIGLLSDRILKAVEKAEFF